jgi:phosphoribosyl-AMP cyclohydrolase
MEFLCALLKGWHKMELKLDANGLFTAVVQDVDTKEVLMVAMMNPESLRLTQDTGNATFWSRSRQKVWMKGETSGNILEVQEIKIDCDLDAVLVLVKPNGPACHTGNQSCFYRTLEDVE